MPRRRKNTASLPVALLLLIIGGVFLLLIRDRDWGGIIFVSGFMAAGMWGVKVAIPRWKRNRLLERIDGITDGHMDALIRQRAIQVRSDPYGRPLLDKWNAEISYFVTHHAQPTLNRTQFRVLEKERDVVLMRISERVAQVAHQRPAFVALPEIMTGAEFEAFCAERLRACGWEVRVTSISRDQGVDVVAEKNGMRVALQCKLYSNPVGNKAVQEIAAGRVHQQAHHGAVITNGTFTVAAKELAATNGIRLLHYTDLTQLEFILASQSATKQLGGSPAKKGEAL